VKPAFASDASVTLEIGGAVISSQVANQNTFGANPPAQPASTAPVLVQWPGASLRAAISASSGGGQPSVLERTGPWSLFRLLEAGGIAVRGEVATANFAVGGAMLRYEFTSAASRNPLNLAMLRAFRCPSGI